MAISPSDLMGVAMLGAMKKNERKRASEALMMTLLPGPPAQKAAMATVAVGTQARDAVRREQRIAEATINAVKEVVVDGAPTLEAFSRQRHLRRLNLPTIVQRFESAMPRPQAPAASADGQGNASPDIIKQAAEMVAQAVTAGGKKFTADEAKAYKRFLDQVDPELVGRIVENPNEDG